MLRTMKIRYIGKGNAMRGLSLARPRRMILAARSALMASGNQPFLAPVMRLLTKPGQITVTLIPSARRLTRSPSPYALTAALLAQYA